MLGYNFCKCGVLWNARPYHSTATSASRNRTPASSCSTLVASLCRCIVWDPKETVHCPVGLRSCTSGTSPSPLRVAHTAHIPRVRHFHLHVGTRPMQNERLPLAPTIGFTVAWPPSQADFLTHGVTRRKVASRPLSAPQVCPKRSYTPLPLGCQNVNTLHLYT